MHQRRATGTTAIRFTVQPPSCTIPTPGLEDIETAYTIGPINFAKMQLIDEAFFFWRWLVNLLVGVMKGLVKEKILA
jgi:hypothetical protein